MSRNIPSVLLYCWFSDWKGIQPTKRSSASNPKRFFFGKSSGDSLIRCDHEQNKPIKQNPNVVVVVVLVHLQKPCKYALIYQAMLCIFF